MDLELTHAQITIMFRPFLHRHQNQSVLNFFLDVPEKAVER